MSDSPVRRFLPMLGHTRGKRSPVICHLKCGDQCAGATCNTSTNAYFRDIVEQQYSRRSALGLGAGVAATVLVPVSAPGPADAGAPAPSTPAGGLGLSFTPIDPVDADVDAFTVPAGYDWSTIIRWGDPMFAHSPVFDLYHQTPEAQALQFGYNCDFLAVAPETETTGHLVVNHEYVNEEIMVPTGMWTTDPTGLRRTMMMAMGMAVVEIVREAPGRPWSYVIGGMRNRRVHMDTPFLLTGPAAGSELVRTVADPTGTTVLGTLNNCAGGMTPWGTVLSGEENFNGFFIGNGTEAEDRYGISSSPTAHGWEDIDPRFNAAVTGYENEPNRFGYIVELDPTNPWSTPRKHTAMGRMKHEGANVRVDQDGTVAAYMGDDEKFEYLYKFVARDKHIEGDRAHNMTLLENGDLYVAVFEGNSPANQIDGTGQLPSDDHFDGHGTWVPLTRNGESVIEGMTTAQVLVNTRAAADLAGATKMDRPEDVDPSPITGKVYLALTNNSDRGAPDEAPADEANPRAKNRNGHVIELTERHNAADATEFDWSILLVAGDPAEDETTYFAGFPANKVSPISCPDNLAFDSEGNLWVSTDGAPSSIGYNDGLFKVTLEGDDRGKTEQFLSVPTEAETTGPVVHDQEGMVYVNVQHPGEDGTFTDQHSFFPDYVPEDQTPAPGDVRAPRPSVAQVFHA